jgi:hypothetical protein
LPPELLLLIIVQVRNSVVPMNPTKLIVVGNGFDLYHGIKSSYSDFREFVEENDDELTEMLEKYFDEEELWKDFEASLAALDTDTLIDDATEFLVGYGSDEWSDANHHDYQEAIQGVTDILTVGLKGHFTDWVLQIEIDHTSESPKLNLDQDSFFICFNYTSTLEDIYEIPEESIWYVHHKAGTGAELILGHGRPPGQLSVRPQQQPDQSDEDYWDELANEDTRVAEGAQLIDHYFAKHFKYTARIIADHKTLFNDLRAVDQVCVLGHSLSEVDIPYFEQIARNVKPTCQWRVSYYAEWESVHHREALISAGVPSDQITLLPMPQV